MAYPESAEYGNDKRSNGHLSTNKAKAVTLIVSIISDYKEDACENQHTMIIPGKVTILHLYPARSAKVDREKLFSGMLRQPLAFIHHLN